MLSEYDKVNVGATVPTSKGRDDTAMKIVDLIKTFERADKNIAARASRIRMHPRLYMQLRSLNEFGSGRQPLSSTQMIMGAGVETDSSQPEGEVEFVCSVPVARSFLDV
jgi:hypothetical protein